MALLMFRTFGVIIVSFIVLIMYVLHRKKNGKFIKRKAVNEEEKIKYQKWEKIINVMAVVGLLILGIFITVPCCMGKPHGREQNPGDHCRDWRRYHEIADRLKGG